MCTQRMILKRSVYTQAHTSTSVIRFTFAKYQKSKSNLFDGLYFFLSLFRWILFDSMFPFLSFASFSFDFFFDSLSHLLVTILSLFSTEKKTLFHVYICALAIEYTKQVFILSSSWLCLYFLYTLYIGAFCSLIRYFFEACMYVWIVMRLNVWH